jgi:hypothetical protein
VPGLPVVAEPFPHAVVDGWWDGALLERVAAEFPDPDAPGWRRYANGQESKLEGPPTLWGQGIRDLLDRVAEQIPTLERAFGIPDLSMETVGGGYHLIPPGGYLNVHTDFSRSPKTGRYRRLNLLVYLNRTWTDPGGRLQLCSADRVCADVAPEWNRTVVFATSSSSWHGHPVPASRWRRSVAAYFYSPEPPVGFVEQSTVWRA